MSSSSEAFLDHIADFLKYISNTQSFWFTLDTSYNHGCHLANRFRLEPNDYEVLLVVAGLAHYTRFGFAMKPTAWSKFLGGGGDENITINHGCGGGDCGGSGNSNGNSDGDDGGDGGDGGGRESDGGVGCGRADVDGYDEDDDGGYGGGKSDNVTTVTGTMAMGLDVAAVAKAMMMTLCQCMRVKRSTTQVAAAVAAVEAVDGEEGVQWRRWGGHSMAESAAR